MKQDGGRKGDEQVNQDVVNHFFHDFHGEISTILMCVAAMRDGVGGGVPEGHRACLDRAVANCDHMVRLINNYRDRTEMEAGTFPRESETLELPGVWRAMQRRLSQHAQLRGVTFELQAEVLGRATFAAKLMQRALLSLLEQAIENTQVGGRALADVSAHNGELVLRVRFESAELDEGEIRSVFDPVLQARTGVRLGRGYTMAFCRQAIAYMGGELRLMPWEGHGNELLARIPFQPGS